MIVRPLTIDEIPVCSTCGEEFYRDHHLPGRFDQTHFTYAWQTVYRLGYGVILGLWDDETFCGGLGALLSPDINDGRLIASEAFWFVTKTYRRGRAGLLLLQAFEAWAQERGASDIHMVQLLHHPTQGLSRLYQRRGYETVEMVWRKPLVKKDM